MKEVKIVLDDQVHRKLKMLAAMEGKTIKRYLTKMILDRFEHALNHELAEDIDSRIDKSIKESMALDKSSLAKLVKRRSSVPAPPPIRAQPR